MQEGEKQVVWFNVPLVCEVVRDDDGAYVATIPEVDDLEGWGHTSAKAREDLAQKVFFRLRMG